MNDKNRPRPQRGDAPPPSRRPPAPRGASADDLLQMADELEEQARDLLRHARQLQRMAEKVDEPQRRPPFRAPRAEGGESGGGGDRPPSRFPRQRSERPAARGGESKPGGSTGSKRGGQPSRRSSAPPAWAPKGKRKRPEK